MSFEIEDGTGVEDAVSYVSVDDARAYASARGVTLSVDDDDIEPLLIKATDYLEGVRDRYKGTKKNGPGFLQWPRVDAWIDGTIEEGIPRELRWAQCQLVIEMVSVDPTETRSGAAVRQEVVGPISTTYAVADGDSGIGVTMPKVDALLDPLFKTTFTLSSMRI